MSMHLVRAAALLFLVGCASGPTPPPPATPTPSPAPAPAAATTTTTGARTYSMADLDALARSQSWGELLDHLEDVSPSARDDHWKGLVVKGSIEALKVARAKEDNRRQLPAMTESLADRYPLLRTSPEFLDARSDVIGDGLRQCMQDNNWNRCEDVAKPLDNDAKHAFANAQIVLLDRSLAMHLFLVAMGNDVKAVCKDDDALSLMLQGQSTEKNYRYFKDSQVVQQRCRDSKKEK